MSGTWRTLAFALALGAGACAHTKTTDDGTAQENKEAKEKEAAKQEDSKETKPSAKGDKQSSELHPGKRDAVPVATAPEALLAPGAEDKIREQLVAGGFLGDDAKGSMREGIRRYQKAHDLPATGVADHETVKGMGLDPNQIFRQGTVKD